MTAEGKRDSAAGELRLADEELQAAEQLLKAGLARIALARAYFAVFHAGASEEIEAARGLVERIGRELA